MVIHGRCYCMDGDGLDPEYDEDNNFEDADEKVDSFLLGLVVGGALGATIVGVLSQIL